MSAVPYKNSVSSMYSTSSAMSRSRSTVLLSRPDYVCRCESCTFKIRRLMETTILGPDEPLMIPRLGIAFGWWNVRLPSKLLEPFVPYKSAGSVFINDDVMNFLEEKGVINWCLGLRQLHPIRTTGDGNCLMHAVILATCGIQDSGLVLRRLVYVALVESTSNSFRERWEKEKQRLNESIPGGLQYTSEEWDKEWGMVVNAAEDLRKTTMAYEFLEEMHVFVLANVILRPIIILGESTVRSPLAGDAIEQNNFVGIYLPLLWRPEVCDPNPVVLCFLHSHFQPLVSRYKLPAEPQDLLAIPLVTSRLEPLHIHFLLPREEPVAHLLLQQYLHTSEVVRKSEDGRSEEAILVAEIWFNSQYLEWERTDYLYVMEVIYALMDAKKIDQGPSTSNFNYIQPGKGDKRVHQTSHDVNEPNHRAVECSHCGKMNQKSKTTQLDSSSIGTLEDSFGDGYASKIQFDTSKGCTIHKDLSSGHLDCADRTKQLQLKQTKDLAGVGQDGRHAAPGVESIPDNVVIFNTLKKLKSPQEAEVGPRTTVSPSTKPGNAKTSKTPLAAEKSRSQPRRRLSDISDADVEYIKRKFTVKTPIYCRSLSLLGRQCAKPDCSQFLAEETDFCCLVHSRPPNPPPPTVVAKSTALCTSPGCLNLGLDHYDGVCARCFVYIALGYSPRYKEVQPRSEYRYYDTPMDSKYKEDRYTKRSVENTKSPLLQQSTTNSSFYSEGLVADKQQKYLPTPPSSSETGKNLKSGWQKSLTEGNTQPLMKSVTTEEVDLGQVYRVYEKQDSRVIVEDFDGWLDKRYPRKVLGDGTLPREPPISGIFPFRDMSVARDTEKLETKARNDCTKTEESFQGRDKQLTIVKDNREGTFEKNALERSTREGKAVEASKEDLGNHLPPITAAKTLRLGAKSENHEELSSDDIGLVDAVLVYSPESKKGECTLPSSAPHLVASGDECFDGEEFPKCLSASCEHVAMDMVAGGYCVTCHAVHGLGRTDAQTGGVADDVSHQLVNMSTQETVVPCVMEGCGNSVTITEFGLCSVCYAHQLKASTTLQSPLQKTVSSANRCVTKAKETSQSSLTSSGLLTQRATRCLRSSCDRYGDPAYRGYCSQCATQYEKSPMEIDSCC